MGESGMPSLSPSFPTNYWNLSGGEMKVLLCLMNTVSGQSPEFPALLQQASQMQAAVNTGSFFPLLFLKQRFQCFSVLFGFEQISAVGFQDRGVFVGLEADG